MNIPPFAYLVPDALSGVPANSYTVRLIHSDGRIRSRHLNWPQLLNSRKWFARQNAAGFNIFFRPDGPYILLDDLTAESVLLMKADGVHVSLLCKTSPDNFQAWVCIGRGREPVDPKLATEAARMLAERYDADMGSAKATQLGRMPGYTNRKPKHQRPDGSFPVVGIRNVPTKRLCVEVVEDAAIRLSERALRQTKHQYRASNDGENLEGDTLLGMLVFDKGVLVADFPPIHMSEMWNALGNTDRSTQDWIIACRMRDASVPIDQAIRIMATHSSKATEREERSAGQGWAYAETTIRRAYEQVWP